MENDNLEKYKTPKICLLKITRNIDLFEYLKNPKPKICLLTFTINGDLLEYFKDQNF